MRQKLLDRPTVEELLLDKAAYDTYRHGSDNSEDIVRMKRMVLKAVNRELTALQRFCLVNYYLYKVPMKDIAKELSVNPSTVSRHIKRATEKLKHIADYY
ncbi:MAG: sigma factor-like helix-turn-helix DNA-binding protein [Eubacteriales bacterium]|nr:sigma factor-like helix-turn-helix DNA-binding protein [Eubacteriales bacterium]